MVSACNATTYHNAVKGSAGSWFRAKSPSRGMITRDQELITARAQHQRGNLRLELLELFQYLAARMGSNRISAW